MKILVTGASGKTGRYILSALVKKGADVCALVHHPNSVNNIKALGIQEVVIGDLTDTSFMDDLLSSIDFLYLIISNMNPDEDDYMFKYH